MIDSADHVTHALPVTVATRLHFTDGKTRAIFTVDLVQDLLGDWVLTQAWDGKEDVAAAADQLAKAMDADLAKEKK